MAHPPNILLIVTDQQRAPQHWPGGQWLRELMPADAELKRTGLSFTQATVNTCMCSPSRATLFTGLAPADHGVTLTLTTTGARPDPRNLPGVMRAFGSTVVRGRIPAGKVARGFVRQTLRLGGEVNGEPVFDPATPNLARLLASAGYHVALKGKWHLSRPLGEEWSAEDGPHLAAAYGFHDWEPPDAGENVEPAHFGGGHAGTTGEGWDEDFTLQAERFLGRDDLPEPFALIVSLVNPHDVLAYPMSHARGGYRPSDFRDLGVALPATVDEALADKPTPHALMRLGQASFLGGLNSKAAQLEYVNFYAYLHGLVDAKVGRLLAALGDPGDPRSLRARTIVVRTADHGEMGLAHGGLRQKMFNAYEETVRVPLVVSNPLLFPQAAETHAPASLVDLAPTLAAIAGADATGHGLRGADLGPVLAHHAAGEHDALERLDADLAGIARRPDPRPSVQEATWFTYDDHKAATFQPDVVGQPNRIRCVREPGFKYAAYHDPQGRAAPEYELYDLAADPLEERNLVERFTGRPHAARHADDLARLRERLVLAPCGETPM